MSFTVGIEVTRRCNFRCGHCFVDAGAARPVEFSGDEIQTLLKDLAACGTHTVAWSGGEPLIRKDLEELTQFARRLGMAIGLASNGFLASKQRLQALKSSGLGIVQISLDGPDPERASRWRQGPSAAFERATEALDLVGLSDRLEHQPSQLSGGQQQRVAIARALVSRPDLILADEPTGALDTSTSEEIMNLFESLNESGMTIIVVTHEPEVAARSRRQLMFRDGRVVDDIVGKMTL